METPINDDRTSIGPPPNDAFPERSSKPRVLFVYYTNGAAAAPARANGSAVSK